MLSHVNDSCGGWGYYGGCVCWGGTVFRGEEVDSVGCRTLVPALQGPLVPNLAVESRFQVFHVGREVGAWCLCSLCSLCAPCVCAVWMGHAWTSHVRRVRPSRWRGADPGLLAVTVTPGRQTRSGWCRQSRGTGRGPGAARTASRRHRTTWPGFATSCRPPRSTRQTERMSGPR